MMETNYENIAMLLKNGTSVEVHADKYSIPTLRLLAQTAALHNAVLRLVVKPDTILAANLNLISQDGHEHLSVKFVV